MSRSGRLAVALVGTSGLAARRAPARGRCALVRPGHQAQRPAAPPCTRRSALVFLRTAGNMTTSPRATSGRRQTVARLPAITGTQLPRPGHCDLERHAHHVRDAAKPRGSKRTILTLCIGSRFDERPDVMAPRPETISQAHLL